MSKPIGASVFSQISIVTSSLKAQHFVERNRKNCQRKMLNNNAHFHPLYGHTVHTVHTHYMESGTLP